jgi:3-deoxy-D-manno-octulosonic-acid transferase
MFKYNLLLLIGWLIVPVVAAVRICTGKDSRSSLLGRFAITPKHPNVDHPIWLHVASIGELNTLETLLPEIERTFKNKQILITVSNIIAFSQAQNLATNDIHITLAPLDFRSVVKRFLRKWNPSAMITIENEIYPNRMTMCRNAGLPIVWINARISKSSFAFWRRNPALCKATVGCIDFAFAQDSIAFKRFKELGVAQDKLQQTPNLKAYKASPKVNHPDLHAIQKVFPYKNTICAASTHKGEDTVLLDALKLSLQKDPSLKMVLAPRHPKRAGEIMALMDQAGISYATRSRNELPKTTDQVYLTNTMGEMDLWYASSAVTFVAGSITQVGGHTPFEPASHGSALIHGSHYANFKDIYDNLVGGGGSCVGDTPTEIADCWEKLRDDTERSDQLKAAQIILFGHSDSTKIIDEILAKTKEILTALPAD